MTETVARPQLSDRYTATSGRVQLTGVQALARLPIDQHRRDLAAGLNVGTFISGYEGSPLAGYDQELGRLKQLLDAIRCHVRPWPERGGGRHLGPGQPARLHPSRRRPRRGDRHLVRQGSRPRPRHRRAAAREPDGLAPQGRGAGPGRRRPGRQVLDPAVRVGRRARRPEHPVPVPGGQPGRARPRPSRDRAVPGIGTVDRAEDRHRGRGRIVNGQPGRGLAGLADPAGCRDARAHGAGCCTPRSASSSATWSRTGSASRGSTRASTG